MNIRFETLFGTIMFCVLVVLLFVTDKSLLGSTEDGFYQQIKPFIDGYGFELEHSLVYVHFLRFIAVLPFVWEEIYDLGSLYNALMLWLFALPFLRVKLGGIGDYLKYFIILVPIFISFRAYLTACSIGYLFIYFFYRRDNFLLFVSFLLACLSSGVVLVWFVTLMINSMDFFRKNIWLALFVICALGVVFMPSIMDKVIFFGESGGLLSIFLRGTLVHSFLNGEWPRFVVYLLWVFATLLIVIRSSIPSVLSRYYLSFFPLLVGSLFEGLGLVCGVIVLLLFYSGFKPSLSEKA